MSSIVADALANLSYYPFNGTFLRLADGLDATCNAGNGYRGIFLNGNYILAHRLAWMMVQGENSLDGLQIDHINGDPLDNRLVNLRPATQSQNCQNKRVSRRSKSGIKGVHFCPERKKWCAFISIGGRQTNLGRFHTKEAAAEAYRRAASIHFGEFARP
jgi:HNH endonuclease/AP2 domain